MKSGNKKILASVLVTVVALITIVSLSGLNFFTPVSSPTVEEEPDLSNMPENLFLKTQDGKNLAAAYFKIVNPSAWVVYLHMMPSTKESFTNLATKFLGWGFSGVAVDLRGHGKSEGGPNGYQNFSDQDHQASYLDVLAAVDFLKSKGAADEKIYLIGASIGANLALKYLAENSETAGVVLLSPGIDYRGITTKDLIVRLTGKSKILFVSSRDDGNNAEEVEELSELVPAGPIYSKTIPNFITKSSLF